MIYKENPNKAYGLFVGDNFINSISNYLSVQESIIEKALFSYCTLIEVGCGKAENHKIATSCGKRYLGIDPVPEYISEANNKILTKKDNCMAIVEYAENISQVVSDYAIEQDSLLVFPFNCFGNMAGYQTVCDALKECKRDFIIFSYKINSATNQQRLEYYKSSNVGEISAYESDEGFRVTSSDGFNSIAFNPHHLTHLLPKGTMAFEFAEIGILYTNIALDPKTEESLSEISFHF